MKTIVYNTYGTPDVLHLTQVETPTPKDNEVLIKIHATTVTAADCMMLEGRPMWGRIILGFQKPRRKTLGLEFAGDIEAVGKEVTQFRVGNKVYGFTGFRAGAHAEYTCMHENGSLGIMPTNLTYEQAAASVDGATTALYFLRDKANIQSGQNVLINGASGSIGTFAVQLAKYFGTKVTGVCSTKNVELVKSLGADQVIDYTQADFTQNSQTYDIIFDTVGKSSFSKCRGSLTKHGCYLPTVGLINNVLHVWTSLRGGKKVISGMSIQKNESLRFLKELIEAGTIKTVVERHYPLEQIAEAFRYVQKGHKQGNVVITVAQ